MKKLTSYDLNVIFSASNNYYREDDRLDLDSQQFMAQCWVKAVTDFLNYKELEFPKQRIVESIDE